MTFIPDVPADLYPPESATKSTIQLSLKAGLSMIRCVEVKKGEHIWWEVNASGDLGFGVLFKNVQDPKEAEKRTQDMGIETVEAVHRIDPSTEEIRWGMGDAIYRIEVIWSVRRMDSLSLDLTIVIRTSEGRISRLMCLSNNRSVTRIHLFVGRRKSLNYWISSNPLAHNSSRMDSSHPNSDESKQPTPSDYEREVRNFREESNLTREIQENYKREALRKCNELHSILLDCYEKKYFCGAAEKEFWDCYRKERVGKLLEHDA